MIHRLFSLRLLALTLLSIFSATAFAQNPGETTVRKKDGRIFATVTGGKVGLFNVNGQTVDPNNLMKSFDFTINWRTLLGEPIEKYDFTWYSTGSYTIDGTTVSRNMLRKYPDLLKRFENIDPYKVWVFVEGFKNPAFMSSSTPDFIYLVDQLKILPNKSGKKGDGIVGGSPNWNEFLDWGNTTDNSVDNVLKFNKRIYRTGPKSDKNLLKSNKINFSSIDEIGFRASVFKVEWHEYELKGILETYRKYESGELKPGGSDDLNDLLSGGDNSGDCEDDLNAMLSGCGQEVTDYEITSRNGKRGVVAGDGRVLIPFKDWNITSYDPSTGLAEVKQSIRSYSDGQKLCGEKNRTTRSEVYLKVDIYSLATVDAGGAYVLPPKKYADVYNSWQMPLYLTMGSANDTRTEEEKRAAKRRLQEETDRNRKECSSWTSSQVSRIKSQLSAQGITVQQL